jgi:hypothetical protein
LTSANRIRINYRTSSFENSATSSFTHISTFIHSHFNSHSFTSHRRDNDACFSFRRSYFRWSKRSSFLFKSTRWFWRLCDRIETYEEVQIASNMQDVNNLWSRQKVSRTCRRTSLSWFKQTYKVFLFHHCEAERWKRRFLNFWD